MMDQHTEEFVNLPERIDFPKEEEKVLELWNNLKAFETCLRESRDRPRYAFYDGPPFATGLPHYGHILAGTIKDTVTRWAHQSGFFVERRFGWDCHGLPVEYEIDQKLGIKSPSEVTEKIGIAAYNDECRKIVMRYSTEWENIVTRLGRWIDFKNDYKTMYPWFMESVWWVFKQLYDKGLVYKGFKVMHYSIGCHTPLSNFEATQNYKEVVDPAVVVSFPIIDDPDGAAFVAWTTTPWTLPSNLSLCVHPDLEYVRVSEKSTNKVFIMLEARLCQLYKNSSDDVTILNKVKGSNLVGLRYEPLFDYFKHMAGDDRKAFRVLADTYVTTDAGTGVVHQAPYHGEDDYRVCTKAGIVRADDAILAPENVVCPVDDAGCFTDVVTDFAGMYVKDADKEILRNLKSRGRLLQRADISHNYPFCWRSDKPLIYRSVPSWFVRVKQIASRLLECNRETYWVPDFVKEKRFANWLMEARDWAISRNRFWGTPIPLWTSEDGEEIVCVGSIEELVELCPDLSSVNDVKDLHRETVDKFVIPSKRSPGTFLHRIPEVFDCWFESGSMPYCQQHYPFEHQNEFESSFPADFIAEGIDQTRGWFYTLLVLSTALFGKPPFKNLIANGLVLASDGQKMSKRKKNYPDPMSVVNNYGADSLRLYLITSPAVRADNLRFKEEGVRDVLKDVLLPWFNAFRFLLQNIGRLAREENHAYIYSLDRTSFSTNYLDRWILSFTQSLIKFVRNEMGAYHLYTVVPRLVKFIEMLTNWYVRMNRKRLKRSEGISKKDCHDAIDTLFEVLYSMTKIMAPFAPFITEYMYQYLRHCMNESSAPLEELLKSRESIHYLLLPNPREELIDTSLEYSVSLMQSVIDLGRSIRERSGIPLKYPLKTLIVIHRESDVLTRVKELENYIKEELNVREVLVTSDKHQYGVQLACIPNHRVLGQRIKGEYKMVLAAIQKLSDDELTKYQNEGELVVHGHVLSGDDLRLYYSTDSTSGGANHSGSDEADDGTKLEAQSENEMLVLLNVKQDSTLLEEGLAREVINRIQKLRKKAGLQPHHTIKIFYQLKATGKNGKDDVTLIEKVIREKAAFIHSAVKQPLLPMMLYKVDSTTVHNEINLCQDSSKIRDASLNIILVGDASLLNLASDTKLTTAASQAKENSLQSKPFCEFINVFIPSSINAENAKVYHFLMPLNNPISSSPDEVLNVETSTGNLTCLVAHFSAPLFPPVNGGDAESGFRHYVDTINLYEVCDDSSKFQLIEPSYVSSALYLNGRNVVIGYNNVEPSFNRWNSLVASQTSPSYVNVEVARSDDVGKRPSAPKGGKGMLLLRNGILSEGDSEKREPLHVIESISQLKSEVHNLFEINEKVYYVDLYEDSSHEKKICDSYDVTELNKQTVYVMIEFSPLKHL